jgi:hypothetical protein
MELLDLKWKTAKCPDIEVTIPKPLEPAEYVNRFII